MQGRRTGALFSLMPLPQGTALLLRGLVLVPLILLRRMQLV